MSLSHTALARRSFLFAATAGTAATAAALLVKKNQLKPGADIDQHDSLKRGYQLTEHVRNYYRTASV